MPHAAPTPRVLPGPLHTTSVHPDRWAALLSREKQQCCLGTVQGGYSVPLHCAVTLGRSLPPHMHRLLLDAEYCARGSLYDVLKQGASSPAAAAELGCQRRLDIAIGAARGLLYLQLSAEPIVHGDVRWVRWACIRCWGTWVRFATAGWIAAAACTDVLRFIACRSSHPIFY